MNRLSNQVLKFAAVAAVCSLAAVGSAENWVYGSSKAPIGKLMSGAAVGAVVRNPILPEWRADPQIRLDETRGHSQGR